MRNQSLNRSARVLLNGGCSVGAVAAMGLLLSPCVAQAQEANGGLEEIVVTAQKKEESLQDVPVAVTAVATAQIENLQIRSLNSLSGLAPNVTTTASVSGSDPTITIRGIIGANATNGTDSAVAMYIDGVYLARTTGASFEVADIERVEVLRGPQGTLYGRSSTGGAVNFITSGPKGEFYARLEGTIGNLDRRRVKVRVDTPTFGGFSFTAAYLHDEQSGWVRNLDGGLAWNFGAANRFLQGRRTSVPSLGAYNSEAGFFAAHYESESGAVKVDYKFDITSSDRANQAQQVLFDGTGALVPPALVSLSRLDAVSMPMTTPERLRTFGHSLTVQAEIGEGLTVKSITGYRGAEDGYTNDVAGSGGAIPNFGTFGMTNIVAYEETRGFQQEVQLNYISKIVDVLGGINYFHERTTSTAPVYIFQAVPFTVPDTTTYPPAVDGDGTANNESIAAFAQATVHLTEQLDITGGIRHTKDNRAVDERGRFTIDLNQDGIPETIIRTDSEASFTKTDWTANVTFRPTDDVTLYAKAGSGYLAGGAFSGIPFQPETVVQYEAGAKADFFDRRLRVNIAAFHTDYKGLQQANFYDIPGSNPPVKAYFVKNVADAEIDGVEVEFALVPVEGLTLSGFYGYNNFRYVTPGQGNPTYRPKHNAALNLNYKLPEFGDGIKPIIDVNARYTGKQFYLPSTYTGALAAALRDNDAVVVDARFTVADIPLAGSRARISAWSKNLFDNRKLANATDATGGNVVNGQFRQPRTYGLDVGFEF